ncbi:hypothetical protein RBWH47_05880 [Rhodopirellula baltica WH47]|uniref:Uncharacterized protein n=1 Tax=Rhodopirellula baltica WH47 TaxID=991778 RepID=F2AW56_RHOBT|nr:hypothetical protein RBWH47_05880 [Rhodopirellula baltica WH47]
MANGQVQSKTFGLMLAVSQPTSLRSDPRGDAPGFDDDGRWPNQTTEKTQLRSSRVGFPSA